MRRNALRRRIPLVCGAISPRQVSVGGQAPSPRAGLASAIFYLIVLTFISQNSALAIVLTATSNSKKSNFENTAYHYTPSLCATSREFAPKARQSRGYYLR
ncbi:hypothetical protein GJ744_000882 [Endocarpon pusillum]|uniref:Uncharacterized protein n=1 Tax=Endocarpon pusillum TaxID=364733 RepID=A0A8H7EAF3_9EURO|nr:hypothetical protein GJ744_000882 [Endocarpon pusillum]